MKTSEQSILLLADSTPSRRHLNLDATALKLGNESLVGVTTNEKGAIWGPISDSFI